MVPSITSDVCYFVEFHWEKQILLTSTLIKILILLKTTKCFEINIRLHLGKRSWLFICFRFRLCFLFWFLNWLNHSVVFQIFQLKYDLPNNFVQRMYSIQLIDTITAQNWKSLTVVGFGFSRRLTQQPFKVRLPYSEKVILHTIRELPLLIWNIFKGWLKQVELVWPSGYLFNLWCNEADFFYSKY